ncbi:SC6A6-like protein [Mya arenaria]|uniref:SC6A6-like protein n=1 Tax=Mya arenaria TaxID=6604 RepID=A0ABY7F5X9_MYAAR|nr:SC6A6-like protein [Mya arenaria]
MILHRDSKCSSPALTPEADVDIEVGNLERGLWANKLHRNGGGAFLIPFFFFLITAGGPLYYLEVCLGQFTGKSAGLAFECCPLLKGIGVLQVMLSLTVLWYVIMVLAWVCYFLYSSFFPVLPWTTCNNHWNTPHCTPLSDMWVDDIVHENGSDITSNITSNAVPSSINSSSAFEFWESSTLCVIAAGFTSFFNGLVVFALLGVMAKQSGMTVHESASQSGPGIAFVAFPTILSTMPLPQLWSVLFFIMLITVVFDSLVDVSTATGQTTSSGKHSDWPFVLPVWIAIDYEHWYFPAFALLMGSFLEIVAVCWVYGTDRFANDIKLMTGREVSVALRVMWTLVIPFFVIRLRKSLQPSENWGPNDVRQREMYHKAYTLPSSLRGAMWLDIRGNR